MADISKIARVLAGVVRNVDLTTNALVVQSIKIGASLLELKETAGDFDFSGIDLANVGNVDGRDVSADGTALDAHLNGGASKHDATEVDYERVDGSKKNIAAASDDVELALTNLDDAIGALDATPTNYTAANPAIVADHLVGIDSALAGVAGADKFVKITAADTTASYLNSKLTAGAALSKSVTNPAGNEELDLAVNVDDSSIEINADALRVKAAGITNAMLAGSIDATKIADGSVTSAEFQFINTLSSNAQTQLTNNATAISDHLADASDAHDASAISSVAAGNLVATDVQAALNELDSEKVAKAGDTMSGNLAMGGNKVTGLAASSANGEAVRHEQLQAALSTIQNFEYQASALDYIVDNTVAPPTEVSGNRYLLSHDGGAPHANYDGAEAGDIVEFNGSLWVETDPSIGMMISVDDESTSLRQWSGSAWVQKFFESTTASTGLVKVGFDVRLDSSAAGAGLGFSAGVLSSNVDDSTIEINADTHRIKALGITNSHINAAAGIVYSKLSLTSSIVNADINAAAAIDYSKLNLASSIVNADVNASAAIAYSKLNLALSIVNADIAAGAAIADSKLATISTANKVSGSAIQLATASGLEDSTGLQIDIDGTTLSKAAAGIRVAALGITAAELAASAVETAKINNAAVDRDKLASNAFDQSTITGGAGTSAAVQHAPLMRMSLVAGEAFAANTSFLVRWAISGETAGRVYKSDKNAATDSKFYNIGIALSPTLLAAADPVVVIALGSHTLGSSDSAFAGADVGKAVFLTSSGAFSLTAPSATDEAVARIGIVQATNKIWVQPAFVAIN